MRLLTSQSGLCKVSPRGLHHADVRHVRIRYGRRGRTRKGSKQRGLFVNARGNTGQRINRWFIGDSRDGGLRGGLRFWFIVSRLVNHANLAIMREKHLAVDCGWDSKQSISVAMPQNNVIIKRGIDDFNINSNLLARKSDRKITE